MDIFKFANPNSPTKMEQGELINGIKEKTWIERFAEAGEFTLKAPVSSGLRTLLPIGSFISHIDTKEVMIVDNHEINEDADTEAQITVTGRGFETFMENRIVSSNMSGSTDFFLPSDFLAEQIVSLIGSHMVVTVDPEDTVPFVSVYTESASSVYDLVDRQIKPGTLYERVLELLKFENLGIKVIRPGVGSPLGSANPNLSLVIHPGVDRSSTVSFSYNTGEIKSADYFWSERTRKNAWVVVGKWITKKDNPLGEDGYDLKYVYVDGSDIDGDLTEAPTDFVVINQIEYTMYNRGFDAIKAARVLALTKAEIVEQPLSKRFREDYEVGDLVTVHGDYNQNAKMRITEYVEIEDETGNHSYPTLTVDSG